MIRVTVKLFWGFSVEGTENIPPQGPAIIASNHRSYVDPPILGAAAPREFYFLAKKELFENIFLGWLITKFNAVPINRGKVDQKGMRGVVDILGRGDLLLVFPEGTRSRQDEFLEPKSGVGKLVLEAKVPIIPTFVGNTGHFVKNIFTGRKVEIVFGEPLSPDYLNKFTKGKASYKKIANEVMLEIKKLKMEKQKGKTQV